MVTLKDIAKEAGVSVMTVSRVINGKTDKVSTETAERIDRIRKEMGYVPNLSARNLAAKTSNIISIIITMKSFDRLPVSPHNATMISVIAKRVQKEGYSLMVNFLDDYSKINETLRSWNVGGAILLRVEDSDVWKICQNNQIPLVFTDCYSTYRQAVNVGCDDFKGGVLAAEYFIKMGHRNLIFVSPELRPDSPNHQRYLGFCHGLKEHGVTLPSDNLLVESDAALLAERLKMLCKHGATGVFLPADNLAVEVIEQCKNKGISVPDDLSFIGFDNQTVSFYNYPKLTTIGQDVTLKAKQAIELLFEQMEGKNAVAQSRVLDVTLIERDSVKQLTSDCLSGGS